MQSRRLLLVRHAQAADAPVDADRPLTSQGELRAAAIGSWLAQADVAPDLVIVSPARRARQTWERASAALTPVPPSAVDQRVYENTVEDLLAVLAETPEDVRTVAVVGHNPSVGELATALDGGRHGSEPGRGLAAGFPAGAVAVFSLETPFAEIRPGGASLSDFTVPGE